MNTINQQASTGQDEMAELRVAVKSIRAEWRERLSLASRLSPSSKLAKKVGVLLLDLESLEDRIAEAGGEEELVFIICAQVAGGCSLTDWCGHYGIERGLVWAFLTETPERFERYKMALRGVADDYFGQMVPIAMGADVDGVQVSKLQIDTLDRVAKRLDRERFGDNVKVEAQVDHALTVQVVRIGLGVVDRVIDAAPRVQVEDEESVVEVVRARAQVVQSDCVDVI